MSLFKKIKSEKKMSEEEKEGIKDVKKASMRDVVEFCDDIVQKNESEAKITEEVVVEAQREDLKNQLDLIKENSKKESKALNATLSEMITLVILVSLFAIKDGMGLWSAILLMATLLSSKIITYVRILLTGEVADAKEEAKDRELAWKDKELALIKERNDLIKDLERTEAVKEWELKATVRKAVILNEELNKVYEIEDLK